MREIITKKRGQQMTLGTIILMVLGIAVLVFLIFGFSTGWSNLWDRITNLGGGNSNLETIQQACELACVQESQAGFCTTPRTVKFGKLVDIGLGVDNKKKEHTGNCNEIATAYTSSPRLNTYNGLRVDKCLTISCN